MQAQRPGRPGWLHALAIVLVLGLLLGGYLAAMQLTIGLSEPGRDPDTRDLVAFYLHVGFLLAGGIVGFLAGKWLNGLGLAMATLAVTVLAIGMVLAHLGSRALACNTEVEVFRHWSCE